jgi:hypothetical protein
MQNFWFWVWAATNIGSYLTFQQTLQLHSQGEYVLAGRSWSSYVVQAVGRAWDVMELIGGVEELLAYLLLDSTQLFRSTNQLLHIPMLQRWPRLTNQHILTLRMTNAMFAKTSDNSQYLMWPISWSFTSEIQPISQCYHTNTGLTSALKYHERLNHLYHKDLQVTAVYN